VGKACRDAADPLEPEHKKQFQSLAATALYVAGDRFEIQNAVIHLMRGMSNPLQLHWLQLCRLASYLHSHPEYEIVFRYQAMPSTIYAEVDADWAGCLETRRSTDGGFEFFGDCLLDGWAGTQQTLSLSSGEAELYGICNGSARLLWTKNLLAECGFTVVATVGTDSTAAKGICSRLGTGKIRHLETRCLWVQERVRSKEINIAKVPTETNRGDMQTKPLDPTRFWMLMGLLPMRRVTTGCSSVSVAMLSACVLVASVGTVEAQGLVAAHGFATREADSWSLLFVAAVLFGIILYNLVLISATVWVTRLLDRARRRPAPQTGLQTDLIRITCYWDMDLARLRSIAQQRGFNGGLHVTKKFLVSWLLEKEHPWMQLWLPV
jgi:hypothetical protein